MNSQLQNEIVEYLSVDYSNQKENKNLDILNAIYHDPFIVTKFNNKGKYIFAQINNSDEFVATIRHNVYVILSNALNYYVKAWQIIKDEVNNSYLLKLTFYVQF